MLIPILQALLDGILIGGVYACIGIGLSLAYGVMGVVNWAHGETLMIGMYLTFFLVTRAGWDPYATIVINVIVLASLGFFLQTRIYNKLIDRGGKAWLNVLLFTAGLSLVLQSLANISFGSKGQSIPMIARYKGMIHIGELMLSKTKLIAFLLAVVFTVAIYLLIQKTETGRAIRATAQDRPTAQLMGINSARIFGFALAISFAMVGAAGAALMSYYTVNPYVGSVFSFKSFVIVALGGKGSIPGALIAGFLIGIIEKLGGLLFNDNIAQIFIFVLFIIFLLIKPEGILSKRVKG